MPENTHPRTHDDPAGEGAELRPFEVRALAPADAPAVRDFVQVILMAHGLAGDHELMRYGLRGEALIAELVATIDGVPVGTVTVTQSRLRPGAAWVSKLFVDPLHRGRRIGRALLSRAVDAARAAGFERIGLSTLPVFREAIRLYDETGWVRAPRRPTRTSELVYWRTTAAIG
jgi:GNAT superfamily N-acetyltransferase